MHITLGQINYLQQIYHLQYAADDHNQLVKLQALRSVFGVTSGAISQRMQQLAALKFVVYHKHRGVYLIKTGSKQLLFYLKAYYLWELLLVK